jgi:starch synthase
LAHRIEAGADALLMPSRYEPCGLNQMYSQLYGTIPIVRRTGGLADSVVDFNQQTLDEHSATGFCFEEDSPEALLATCLGALSLFRNQRVDWWKLVIAGMKRDFSWTDSAGRYSELYSQLINNRLHGGETAMSDTLTRQLQTDSPSQTGHRIH